MKLKTLSIKNFRNFEDISITLSNKNVVFGMNDVGKTNFLYALRFLFERKIRNKGFLESDFFQIIPFQMDLQLIKPYQQIKQ